MVEQIFKRSYENYGWSYELFETIPVRTALWVSKNHSVLFSITYLVYYLLFYYLLFYDIESSQNPLENFKIF